jgi:hypothetical protein
VGFVLWLVALRITSPERPDAAAETLTLPDGRVRIEVLNRGGVRGMAREATEHLRDAGFDVVDVGNAAVFDPERPSVVIDRVDRPDAARAVAIALGIDIVLSEPDPNLYVDVSVLLGSDWTRPDLADPSSAEHAWWDPRGWVDR